MKVKILGAGSIGNHLAQASRRLGWEVAVVDTDPAALKRMKEEIYPTRYGAWDDAIALYESGTEPKGGFDVICIGTPPDSHVPLALSALNEKPKILQVEKPFCGPGLEGVEEFLRAYRAQKDTVAIVGYDHAISKSIAFVADFLRQKSIGEVETLDVEFREHWGGIFKAHPWLSGPADSYLAFIARGGGASGEHSHALHLFQYLAGVAGLGKWNTVVPFYKMETEGGVEYDSVAAFSFGFETGKTGRVVQDVITAPTRKWLRLQGSEGFIEWICNGAPEGDLVRYGKTGGTVREEVFPKKRPDDFYQEVLHMQDLMDKKISSHESPVALESALAVMAVLATSYTNRAEKGHRIPVL